MKNIAFLTVSILLIASISLAYAAHEKRIELTDGSTLNGEIVSFSEGKYTVKSPSLGVFQIEDSKVRTMSNVNQVTVSPQKDIVSSDPTVIQSEIQKLQPAMTSDPDIMRIVVGLISDPDFQALLKDPEIMNAAKSSDVKTLMANEKFINAINNPAIQEINQKIKEEKSEQEM